MHLRHLWIVPLLFSLALQGADLPTPQTSDTLYDAGLHLFPDNAGIERSWQMSRVLGVPERLSGPLVVPDKPWETGPQRVLFLYGGTGSVIYDSELKKFRMWYGVISFSGDTTSTPPLLCYAESDDGLHWRKPALGIVDYQGSKQNNIVYSFLTDDGLHHRYLFSVFRDETEKDPNRRYKGIGWIQATGFHVVTSLDGLHWSSHPKLVSTIGGDTVGITWDPIRKQYLMAGRGVVFSKDDLFGDKVAKGNRMVGIFESPTMDRWRYEGLGLQLDEDDGFGRISQHWVLNPFVYGNDYLGVLNVTIMRAIGRTNRLELVNSHDGRSWQYVSRRETFLNEGPPGHWDSSLLCLASGPPVPVGDYLYFYYTVRASVFTIGLSKVRRDRFVGLRSGPGQVLEGDPHAIKSDPIEPAWGNFQPPYVLTRSVKVTGPKLQVNVNTQKGGMLKVSVRKAYVDNNDWGGPPIPGYTSEECAPISGDGTRLNVHWKNHEDLSELVGKEVSLMFELKDGTLWSYRFTQ